jgi:hypothetical protein
MSRTALFFEFNRLEFLFPATNVTKINILSNPNGDSRPTHPTSSIYTMDEVPLSRGVARRAGVCLPRQQNDIS